MQGVFEFYRDLPARPKRPETLFFGLFPDDETALRIDRFRQQFIAEKRWEGRPLKPERLHVSLHHVGDFPRLRTKDLYAARQAGAAISMGPFELTARFVKSFEGVTQSAGEPRTRPLVLLIEGDVLSELHRTLGAAMKKIGLRAAEDFTPHMTLSYGSRAIPMQAIEPIRFAVDKVVLIHSERWLTRYHVIESWPLRREDRSRSSMN